MGGVHARCPFLIGARRRLMAWFYLVAAIFFETLGTTALQASQQFTRLAPSVLVVISYALAFFLLSQVLRSIPVGVAYAIWSGLGICFITAIAWVMFGQRLDLPAVIGITMIIAGIIVIQLFSKAAHH